MPLLYGLLTSHKTSIKLKCYKGEVLDLSLIMHLSISCPTPGEGGGIQGFDKSSRQMPHPWGEVGCQIPTMSPGSSRGFDS